MMERLCTAFPRDAADGRSASSVFAQYVHVSPKDWAIGVAQWIATSRASGETRRVRGDAQPKSCNGFRVAPVAGASSVLTAVPLPHLAEAQVATPAVVISGRSAVASSATTARQNSEES